MRRVIYSYTLTVFRGGWSHSNNLERPCWPLSPWRIGSFWIVILKRIGTKGETGTVDPVFIQV